MTFIYKILFLLIIVSTFIQIIFTQSSILPTEQTPQKNVKSQDDLYRTLSRSKASVWVDTNKGNVFSISSGSSNLEKKKELPKNEPIGHSKNMLLTLLIQPDSNQPIRTVTAENQSVNLKPILLLLQQQHDLSSILLEKQEKLEKLNVQLQQQIKSQHTLIVDLMDHFHTFFNITNSNALHHNKMSEQSLELIKKKLAFHKDLHMNGQPSTSSSSTANAIVTKHREEKTPRLDDNKQTVYQMNGQTSTSTTNPIVIKHREEMSPPFEENKQFFPPSLILPKQTLPQQIENKGIPSKPPKEAPHIINELAKSNIRSTIEPIVSTTIPSIVSTTFNRNLQMKEHSSTSSNSTAKPIVTKPHEEKSPLYDDHEHLYHPSLELEALQKIENKEILQMILNKEIPINSSNELTHIINELEKLNTRSPTEPIVPTTKPSIVTTVSIQKIDSISTVLPNSESKKRLLSPPTPSPISVNTQNVSTTKPLDAVSVPLVTNNGTVLPKVGIKLMKKFEKAIVAYSDSEVKGIYRDSK